MGLGVAAGPPGRTPTTATQSNPEAHVEVTTGDTTTLFLGTWNGILLFPEEPQSFFLTPTPHAASLRS